MHLRILLEFLAFFSSPPHTIAVQMYWAAMVFSGVVAGSILGQDAG
jgi:hypothetical protein